MTPVQGCKLAFFALLFSQLFVASYYPDLAASPEMRLGAAMAGGLLALAWARFDAALRGVALGVVMRIGLVLLAAAFVPAWLFRSRPPEQAWSALGRFTLQVLALLAVFWLGVAVLAAGGIGPVMPPA